NRRGFFFACVAVFAARPAMAAGRPLVTITKDPSCGCCTAWAEHIAKAGFPVKVFEDPAIEVLKTNLGIPTALRSCHTAQVEGYVLEGHVPAAALIRLLAEKPQITGLAVAGMPIGSPGMEVPGSEPEAYNVMAFGPAPSVFMRFRG